MKKKFSKQALYDEWTEYRKWYEKQEQKGMALSGRSYIIYGSFSEYMFYRDAASEGLTRSKDVLAEMKRLSFETSSRQLTHLANEIQTFLDEASEEQKIAFINRFGAELPTKNGKIDADTLVYDTLHGKIAPLTMVTGKSHGWYGVLAEMMTYIETLGFSVSWNS